MKKTIPFMISIIAIASIASIAVLGNTQNAFATVTSGAVTGGTALTLDGGVFEKLFPPIGPVGNDNHQSSNLFAFDETQNVVIPAGGVTTDQCFNDVGTCPIPEGTIVASHYVFFDPDPTRTQDGTVDFDSDVYAIISGTANLLASDFLITTNADYQNPGDRGIEGGDTVSRTGPQQITVDWAASTPGDYIRILTVFSPGGVEVCDEMDNDGDGEIDEGLNCDVVPACGDMYVVTGGEFQSNTNVDGGALALVDFPGSGALTQIGASITDQVERRSLPGMAFDSNGRLFVVAQGSPLVGDGASTPILLEINPSTGAIIENIGPVIDDNKVPVRLRDLAMRNNVLWGVGEDNSNFEAIFTISTTTAVVGPLGDTGGLELNGLAITPDGTFFATERFANELYTVDPMTGDTTFEVLLDTRMDGLGSDDLGRIFGTETGPDSVHLIDISDGSDETVGAVGDNPSDVDFFPCPIVTPQPPVGGEIIPIESTSLILAGLQSSAMWMLPILAGAAGAGFAAFKLRRK